MGNSVLGLLFEISADPSKAEEAIKRFNDSTGNALKEAGQSAQPLEEALLSNRESVRLLGEEMGIHLPRAVSGAVAEMLPSIGQLGGAVLGVFAITEVTHWAEVGADKIREMFAVADDSVKALDAAAGAAFKHVKEQADSTFTSFKTSLAGAFDISEIDARAAQLEHYYDAFKMLNEKAGGDLRNLGVISAEAVRTIASAANEGITSEKQVVDKINEIGQLQFQARQHLKEVTAAEKKAAAEAAKREADEEATAAQKALALAEHVQQEENRLALQKIRIMQEAGREVARIWSDEAKSIDIAMKGEKADIQALQIVFTNFGNLTRTEMMQLAPTLEIVGDQTKHLSAARKELVWITQELHETERKYSEGVKDEIKAVHDDLLASTGQLAGGLAGLIAGRRAQAGVEGAFEVAKGIMLLAEGTWPPNPAALVASGLHFEAAAEFFKVAGSGSSRHGGGGGAGAGSYRSGGDHGGYGSRDSGYLPQTLAPGAASQGGRFSSPGSGVIVVHGSTDLHQWVAGLVNEAVDRGITVTASRSQRGAAVGH